jgi:hypothetical protein
MPEWEQFAKSTSEKLPDDGLTPENVAKFNAAMKASDAH